MRCSRHIVRTGDPLGEPVRFLKRLRWRLGFARVVRSQVRTGRPPEARAVYARLLGDGYSSRRAYALLAAVYEAEVAAMMIEERVYDHQAYLQRLLALPRRPDLSLDAVGRRRRS
jgi:hypothetical protein